jgi:hypothetical protein
MKPNKLALDYQFNFSKSQHWISIAAINYWLAYETTEQNETPH